MDNWLSSLDYVVDLERYGEAHAWSRPLVYLAFGIFGAGSINLVWMILLLVAFALVTVGIYLFLSPDAAAATPSLRGFVRFSFPRAVWLHRTTGVDISLLFFNAWLFRLSFIASLPAAYRIGTLVRDQLRTLAGSPLETAFADAHRGALLVVYGLGLFLATDFSDTFAHYLSHRIRPLWELHKVHHSAEELTPLTAFREHPILLLLELLFTTLVIGGYQGFASWLAPSIASAEPFLTGNLISYLVVRTLFLLGHSSGTVSFGPLDRVFVSPAYHRVHHGRAPEFHDRNFGSRLTLWDALLGTYVKPDPSRPIVVGTDDVAPWIGARDPSAILWRPIIAALRGRPRPPRD